MVRRLVDRARSLKVAVLCIKDAAGQRQILIEYVRAPSFQIYYCSQRLDWTIW
jgi:hypothetical protein